MIDFPAHMVGTPCVVVNYVELPAGVYDAQGNCMIKVPFRLTRPDEPPVVGQGPK